MRNGSQTTPLAPEAPAVAPAPAVSRAAGTIDNIQTLRALAALLVVFVHLDLFLRALGVAPFGHGGVDLFFIISGFIMVHTTRARPITPLAFMLNRFTRIAPIYWLITLAVFALALVAPKLLQATSSDPEQLAKSLLFIPFQKANGLVQPVLFVGWTLNYEMFFYALFAVGLLFPRRSLGVMVVAAFIGLLVAFGLWAQPASVLGAFYTRPIILEFAAGMLLGLASERLPALGRPAAHGWLGAALLGLVAIALVPLWLPEQGRLVTQGLPAFVVATAAIVLHRSGVQVSSRTLSLLGDASYSLYLTHPFVTQAMQKVGKALGLSPLLAAGLMLPTLLLVCGVGIATHLWIERPLTRLFKRAIERLSLTPSASPTEAAAPRLARVD